MPMLPKITSLSTFRGDILIVDDALDNLRLLANILEPEGYLVRKAISGKLALKAIQMAPPDLILLDINMPQMNGFEICQHLKANPQTERIPIIFVSALDRNFNQLKDLQLGADDYITKPFQVEEILALVENKIKHQKLVKQVQFQNSLLLLEMQSRQQAETETQFFLTISEAINQTSDFAEAIQVALEKVCQLINWDFGEAWIPNEEKKILQYSCSRYAKHEHLSGFGIASENYQLAPLEGLPGRTWVSKQIEWIENISASPDLSFVRYQLAEEIGLKSAISVPVLEENNVLVILVFYHQKTSQLQPRILTLIKAITTQLSLFILRKKAEFALSAANQKLVSLTTIDELTQVANRRRFDEVFVYEWRRLAREEKPLSLIFCNLNYFLKGKVQETDNFYLKKVAVTITRLLKRPADLVARYEDQKFAVILPNTQLEGANYLAKKISQEINFDLIADSQFKFEEIVNLTLGVATMIPEPKINPQILIKIAEEELAASRRREGNYTIGLSSSNKNGATEEDCRNR
ncbi:MAG: response regulator [Oscillatoria sp. PMC 1068.18]|nr:response regulator [Oscillatoria sp. PMC 1076.18]MEC4991608.1 response regulator [Oscillatoria sp. PMC 1068.18]